MRPPNMIHPSFHNPRPNLVYGLPLHATDSQALMLLHMKPSCGCEHGAYIPAQMTHVLHELTHRALVLLQPATPHEDTGTSG